MHIIYTNPLKTDQTIRSWLELVTHTLLNAFNEIIKAVLLTGRTAGAVKTWTVGNKCRIS